MATRPDDLPGPLFAKSQPMSRRMPRMSPSSGAKSGMLSKLERTAEGTILSASQRSERDLRGPRRAHGVEEIEHAAVDEREQRLRIEAEHEHDDRERYERRDLTHVDFGELAAGVLEVMAVPPFLAEF